MTAHASDYSPQRWRYERDHPIERLIGGDELLSDLVAAIDHRLRLGERHVHPKRGGCSLCSSEIADTVVRFLEAQTRVVKSDALDGESLAAARQLLGSVPYLGDSRYMRTLSKHAHEPDQPTVDDLIADLGTIIDGVKALVGRERDREAELRTYRAWAGSLRDMAAAAVEQLDAAIDP